MAHKRSQPWISWQRGPRSEPLRLAAVLQQEPLLRTRRDRLSVLEWETAVGERLAKVTEPVRIDRGVLMVIVTSSIWAQELSLLSETILQRLRSGGRTLRGLRFQIGVPAAQARKRRPQARETHQNRGTRVALPESVQHALSSVRDDELARVIAEAAAHGLAVQGKRRV